MSKRKKETPWLSGNKFAAKPDAIRKDASIYIDCTVADKQEYAAAAKAIGKSMAQWVRDALSQDVAARKIKQLPCS